MRRLVRLVITATVGILGCAALALPAAAVAVERPPALVQQGTDDFTFDSWHSDFTLGRTPDGHSRLSTTETIVAQFPGTDQNHGIRRAIPTEYDGHPTNLEIRSVTDEHGRALDYDTDSTSDDDGDFLVVTIAADDFVHGRKTYVISYTQTNITLYPKDAHDEEFFWEVNGTGWAQPFGSVTATLHVAAPLVPRLTGRAVCLAGPADATRSCDGITSTAEGDGWRVDATATKLAAHEGLAIVVGFTPGTFVPRDDSFTAGVSPSIGLAGALAAILALIVTGIARFTRWADAPGRPTIVAEYLPPPGVNLLGAGNIAGESARAIPAQILSLAVRGNLRVLEAGDDGSYLLEYIHDNDVDQAEASVLAHLFPDQEGGSLRDLSVPSPALATAMQGQLALVPEQVLAAGLRRKRSRRLPRVLVGLAVVAGLVGAIGSIVALGSEIGGLWPALTLLVALGASIAALVFVGRVQPLTPSGSELRDYLAGLKLYIDLAEEDRLRVLQSPQGALRSPYRPDGTAASADGRTLEIVKLYERVLPYAVLFGQEKKWAAVLAEYYSGMGYQPGWYSGQAAFNAVYFSAAIGSFATSTATAWSGSSGSSSSSGFGGGISVGAGGGGGGGGGV